MVTSNMMPILSTMIFVAEFFEKSHQQQLDVWNKELQTKVENNEREEERTQKNLLIQFGPN